MGERLHGMQEVIGSIPIISTTKNIEAFCFDIFLCFFAEKRSGMYMILLEVL